MFGSDEKFNPVKFVLVKCSGRYSTNPMAFGDDGYIKECLRLPSGQWMKNLPGFSTVFSEGGKNFLLTRRRLAQLVDEKTLRVVVSSDDGTASFRPIRWEGPYLGYRYIEVIREGRKSHFGGLLECKNGKWIFHQYHQGQNRNHVEHAKFQYNPQKIVLTFYEWGYNLAPQKTEFDPVKGTFTDQ